MWTSPWAVEARRLPLAKEGEFPKSGHRVGGLASHGHGTPPSPSPGAGVGYTISHLGGGQGSAEKQPERRPRGRDGPRVRSQDPCPPLLPEDQRAPSWPESDKSWGRRGKAPDVELLLSHPLKTRNSRKFRGSACRARSSLSSPWLLMCVTELMKRSTKDGLRSEWNYSSQSGTASRCSGSHFPSSQR